MWSTWILPHQMALGQLGMPWTFPLISLFFSVSHSLPSPVVLKGEWKCLFLGITALAVGTWPAQWLLWWQGKGTSTCTPGPPLLDHQAEEGPGCGHDAETVCTAQSSETSVSPVLRGVLGQGVTLEFFFYWCVCVCVCVCVCLSVCLSLVGFFFYFLAVLGFEFKV
jgi:hypothetical protein